MRLPGGGRVGWEGPEQDTEAGSETEGAEENHFREYMRAVRKHLWLVVGITLFATADGVVKYERQGRDRKKVSVYPAQASA